MDGIEIKALNDINLEINKGQFVSIMGPSGSGKSTLMYIIGCLDNPTSGQIIFDGKDVSTYKEKDLAKIRNRGIGFIFQMFNLLPRTTSLANVELPLIYSGVSKSERDQRAKEALDMVGLSNRLNHFPSQLSGGQQQRVAIARALINNPPLILADEPTGNIDSKSADEIMELLTKLNKEGRTIILVTHDQEVADYAEYKISVRDGRIL
ncbi:MAG: ABC transporter ATP-binding protein [Candidatus Gottesmanbacteria bacterium]